MVCPPLPPSPAVAYWLERHQGPTSFALHMVGIPLTVLGVLMLPISFPALSLPLFFLAIGLFVGGYLFQFLGHALEGTDAGEIILLKRRLGWPYVEFAPGREPKPSTT